MIYLKYIWLDEILVIILWYIILIKGFEYKFIIYNFLTKCINVKFSKIVVIKHVNEYVVKPK